MRRLALLLIVALFSTALFASPSTAAAADGLVPWSIVDVVVHSEQGSTVLLVSGELPPDTKLPAKVALSVPAGAQLQWAGEILGGDASADPTVETALEKGEGADVYTFTLTQSRTGQIEVAAPEALAFDGSAYAANVNWVAPVDAAQVRIGIRTPQGASLTGSDGQYEQIPGPAGFSYWRKTVPDVKAGDSVTMAMSYTAPAPGSAAAGPTAPASGVSPAVIILVLLFGAFLVVFGVAVARKRRPVEDDDADFDEDVPASSAASTPSVRTVRAQGKAAPDEGTSDDQTRAPRRVKPVFVIVGVMVVLGIGAAIAVGAGNSGVAMGDTVTMQYAQVDACTTGRYELKAPAGANLAEDANAVLATLRSLSGVGGATLFVKENRLEVGYCESSASSEQIVAALETSGYGVTPLGNAPVGSGSAPAPAPGAPASEPASGAAQ